PLMTPQTHRYTLFPYTTLFRSKEILEAGNKLISNNQDRLDKTLQYHKDSGEQSVFYHNYNDETEEAIEVIQEIKHITEHENVQRSDEHTSELQSRSDLVCRLLL